MKNSARRSQLIPALVVLAALLAVGTWLILGYAQKEKERDLHGWQTILGTVADSRAQSIGQWLDAQTAVIREIAENASVRFYLTQYIGTAEGEPPTPPAQAGYLRNLLEATAERSRFSGAPAQARVPANIDLPVDSGLVIIDQAGKTIAETSGFRTDDTLRATLMEVIKSGKPALQDFYTNARGEVVIGFVMAILFGPVFCGWICPFGSLQEWLGGIGRKLFKKRRYNNFIPEKIDRVLRYARYLVLAWVIYMTAATGTLIFAEYDPYFAMFNFWSDEVAVSGLVILGITILASLFVERPWCKYACPYGAVLGLTNLFRIFRIRRVPGTCKLDGACDINCPMNIKVSEKIIIRDHQCISCLECTSEAKCPAASTVDFVSIGAK